MFFLNSIFWDAIPKVLTVIVKLQKQLCQSSTSAQLIVGIVVHFILKWFLLKSALQPYLTVRYNIKVQWQVIQNVQLYMFMMENSQKDFLKFFSVQNYLYNRIQILASLYHKSSYTHLQKLHSSSVERSFGRRSRECVTKFVARPTSPS